MDGSTDVAGTPYKQKQRRAQGRQDKDGSSKVIVLDELRKRLDDLVALKIKAGRAQKAYTEAVTATAEKSGLLSSVVNHFIAKRAGSNFLDAKKRAEQLALVFEEIPLIEATQDDATKQ